MFTENTIRQLPEYQTILSLQGEQSAADSDIGFSIALKHFANDVAEAVYDGTLDEVLDDCISILISDFTGKDIEWTCKSSITGVLLEKQSYIVGKNLILRRPTPADIPSEWVIDPSFFFRPGRARLGSSLNVDHLLNPGKSYDIDSITNHRWTGRTGTIVKLSAVLDTKFTLPRAKKHQVHPKLQTTINALTLFKTGSAFEIRSIVSPRSFREFVWTYIGEAKIPTPDEGYNLLFNREFRGELFHYTLREGDIPKLQGLIKTIESKYPEGLMYLKRESPVFIALSRYRAVFLGTEHSGIAGQITSTVMALEALFLKGGETSELSRRLSQRVAALTRHCGIEPAKAYKELKESYNISSHYVHGTTKSLPRDAEALELAKRILSYARISILIFLQLHILTNKSKTKFIDEIDESLLDHARYEHLHERLGGLCYYDPAEEAFSESKRNGH